MFSLNKKVALITGGGSGIGKAITELFCNQGATVLILEVNSATAGETVKSCKASGGNARAYICDVSDHHSVIKLIHEIIEEYKRIDILVNSAGIAHIGKLE